MRQKKGNRLSLFEVELLYDNNLYRIVDFFGKTHNAQTAQLIVFFNVSG
jgi:hypothetical protein